MKACPYIQFASYSFAAGLGFEAPVWRRATTCELLHMTEQQFVELCIFKGNDFTKDYGKALFNRPSNCVFSEYELCDTALADHMWSSAHPKLQRAIDFSRDFYELHDLRGYGYDDRYVYPSIYTLRREEELILHGIFYQYRALGLRELLSKCYSIICPGILPVHLRALELTTSTLTPSSVGKESTTRPQDNLDTPSESVPTWYDVIAADLYQMIYKEWRYWLKNQRIYVKVSVCIHLFY